MKKLYPWLILIAILLPFVLNIFIGFNAPDNVHVIGNPSDWLLFYGSYIGGVLTAIIGFITMIRTSYQNRISIEIAYKQESIKELEKTLAQCVSLFNYSRIGIIAMHFGQDSKYDDVLKEMDEYLNKISTAANAWGVIYADSEQTEIQQFQDAYLECVNFLTSQINAVTKLICELKGSSKKKRQAIWKQINVIIKFDYRGKYLDRLFRCAKNWIGAEKRELEQLKAKLS